MRFALPRFFSVRNQVNIPLQAGEHAGVEYAAIPRLEIPALAREYFTALETEESDAWCKCFWRIHPDDVNLKGGCRECGAVAKSPCHQGASEPQYNHQFRGIRKVKVDEHPECPVHTREGMLIHFFEWVNQR